VCPVGLVTSRETYTPHAWALTIESVKRGQLTWNEETGQVLYACADCGLCQAHCVTDQALPDAIVSARTQIAGTAAAPAIVSDMADRLESRGHPYVGTAPAPSRAHGATALFVGDAAFHLRPAVFEAAMRLLRVAGTEVVPVGVGVSSGALASSLGLRDLASRQASRVVDEIRSTGCREVLALSAADRWAFEHVYPRRLDVPWPETVGVRTVTAVLASAASHGRLPIRPRGDRTGYALHDGCHSARVAHDPSPRALLSAAFETGQSCELFWRADRAHPCGATSGLQYTHPEIAGRLAQARVADARAAGARWLVTDDPACVAHLTAAETDGLTVLGLYELLAERLDQGPRS
jgi:Fe-S oxidoreductase